MPWQVPGPLPFTLPSEYKFIDCLIEAERERRLAVVSVDVVHGADEDDI